MSAGRTPLMYACTTNRLKAVELLLKQGCDPKIRDSNGRTALLWAAYYGMFCVEIRPRGQLRSCRSLLQKREARTLSPMPALLHWLFSLGSVLITARVWLQGITRFSGLCFVLTVPWWLWSGPTADLRCTGLRSTATRVVSSFCLRYSP